MVLMTSDRVIMTSDKGDVMMSDKGDVMTVTRVMQ